MESQTDIKMEITKSILYLKEEAYEKEEEISSVISY